MKDSYVKFFVLVFFCSVLFYLIYFFTGVTEGMIKPEVIYSYLTGIISGKLLSEYFDDTNGDSQGGNK